MTEHPPVPDWRDEVEQQLTAEPPNQWAARLLSFATDLVEIEPEMALAMRVCAVVIERSPVYTADDLHRAAAGVRDQAIEDCNLIAQAFADRGNRAEAQGASMVARHMASLPLPAPPNPSASQGSQTQSHEQHTPETETHSAWSWHDEPDHAPEQTDHPEPVWPADHDFSWDHHAEMSAEADHSAPEPDDGSMAFEATEQLKQAVPEPQAKADHAEEPIQLSNDTAEHVQAVAEEEHALIVRPAPEPDDGSITREATEQPEQATLEPQTPEPQAKDDHAEEPIQLPDDTAEHAQAVAAEGHALIVRPDYPLITIAEKPENLAAEVKETEASTPPALADASATAAETDTAATQSAPAPEDDSPSHAQPSQASRSQDENQPHHLAAEQADTALTDTSKPPAGAGTPITPQQRQQDTQVDEPSHASPHPMRDLRTFREQSGHKSASTATFLDPTPSSQAATVDRASEKSAPTSLIQKLQQQRALLLNRLGRKGLLGRHIEMSTVDDLYVDILTQSRASLPDYREP